MIRLLPDPAERTPDMPLAPMIDIMAVMLIFFMTLSVYYQLESEISITVPKAEKASESSRSPGEIIINVDSAGGIVVNQKAFDKNRLEKMLKRISSLYPNQPVIIRADKKTPHEYAIRVLDACAGA